MSKPVAPKVAYERARTRVRAQHRDLARVARGGIEPPNFHTHIGRPTLDRDGCPAYERVPSIHGKGHYRVRYEYVPIFADPEMTARVMVRAATRKAALDAKRAAKGERIAETLAWRAVKRGRAEALRKVRDAEQATRRLRAVTAGRKGWTLPRYLRERVAAK